MTASQFIQAFPRFPLAFLPTPLEPLPRFSALLGGPEIWIKRDDQTGLATGGNKARKLEYLIGAALAEGADSVITAGSTQSNHARQTAAAARKAGLEPHLVLYAPGGVAPSELSGNVLLMTVLGATIHWTTERAPYTKTITEVANSLHAEGRNPYIVPYGGSSMTGVLGYITAMDELAEQINDTPLEPFDVHVFATSSGATHAGMILGTYLAEVHGRILGISVDGERQIITTEVANLANQTARMLGVDWRVNMSAVEADDNYLGGGYAVVGEPEQEAIRLLAQSEGILVDPVYTGRALAGLIGLIRSGSLTHNQRVLFWHTGGVAAMFAFADHFRT